MEAPFNMEDKLWKAVVAKEYETVEDYITDYSVIVFNGVRYFGDRFVELIKSLSLKTHTLDNVEVVMNEGNMFQILYNTRIVTTDGNSDLNGDYYITTTWQEVGDSADIVCSMINKIA